MKSLTNYLILWDYGSSKTKSSIQKGVRPAYVVKDLKENLLIIPVTTKCKNGQATHCFIQQSQGDVSIALAEQISMVKKPEHPIVLGKISDQDRTKVMHSLDIAIGLEPIQIRREFKPKVYRGQVFDTGNEKFVVIQNNIGNTFSPTTIVADIDSEKGTYNILGIRTIDRTSLESLNPIGELRTNQALRRFIS